MRVPLCSAVLLCVAATACSTSPAPEGSAESDITSSVLTFESFVAGTHSFDELQARVSFDQACVAFADRQRAAVGASFLDATCEAPANQAPTGFLFAAKVNGRLVATLDDGAAMPLPERTTTVHGGQSFNQSEAFARWQDACATELTRARALFGERLLAGGCNAPANTATTGFLFQSPFRALVRTPPASGTLEAALRGALSFNATEALGAWTAACDAWRDGVAATAGSNLVMADCGAPENEDTAGFLFRSAARVTVSAGAQATDLRVLGSTATGTQSFNQTEAYGSWSAACRAEQDLAKELLGERALVAACREPENLSTTGFLYSSQVVGLARSTAGTTTIDVPGWIAGRQSFNQSEALAGVASATRTLLRGQVARVGSARLDRYEVREPTNVATSGFQYGTSVTLRLAIEVPAGGLQPITTTATVRGPQTSNLSEAATGWAASCAAAADKARVDLGDRFIAASCAEPTRNGATWESTLTTWILP